MSMELRVKQIINYTVVDGHGLRLSVYMQGCNHGCAGCHNPQSHDPYGGYLTSVAELMGIIINTPYIRGVTLTGGDPLFQYPATLDLSKRIKELTSLDLIMYTGYTYETVKSDFSEILEYIDFLVDRKFVQQLKSHDLYFTGSSNQRYIDVKQSDKQSIPVLRNRYASVSTILESNGKYRRV